MFEIKTNKEYQALLHEIEMIKDSNSREEEEILRLMDEIDEAKKSLSKKEKEVVILLEKIEVEKKTIQEKMTHDDAGWSKQKERRETLAKQLESKLYRLYNTLREKRQEVSVVRAIHEICQGCFLNIPPQTFNEVQKNDTLIQCPHCIAFCIGMGMESRHEGTCSGRIHRRGQSGKPWEAGAGVWITDENGTEVGEVSRYLGHKTNNEAEYGLSCLGWRKRKRLGGHAVRVFTDSELIARQVKGIYRVKDMKLRALYKTVIQSLKGFSSFDIESIPRELNREADRLANHAIQTGSSGMAEKGGNRRGRDGRSS